MIRATATTAYSSPRSAWARTLWRKLPRLRSCFAPRLLAFVATHLRSRCSTVTASCALIVLD